MMKAFVSCDWVATDKVSGYKTPKRSNNWPMDALLYASDPIASPEKSTMKNIDRLEYKTGDVTYSTSISAAGAAWACTLDSSSLAAVELIFRSFSATCEGSILENLGGERCTASHYRDGGNTTFLSYPRPKSYLQTALGTLTTDKPLTGRQFKNFKNGGTTIMTISGNLCQRLCARLSSVSSSEITEPFLLRLRSCSSSIHWHHLDRKYEGAFTSSSSNCDFISKQAPSRIPSVILPRNWHSNSYMGTPTITHERSSTY